MAFCLEYTVPYRFLRSAVERAQAVTLGVLVYAGLARAMMISNEYSCLGSAVYLGWILTLFLLRKPYEKNERYMGHCQELLDALSVGCVLQFEDNTTIANSMAFDLLKVKRGNLTGLHMQLERQQAPAESAKPENWTPFLSTNLAPSSTSLLDKNTREDTLSLEYTSKAVIQKA